MLRIERFRYERIPSASDLVFAKDLSGDIGMGKWSTGSDTLLTTAASTCIILAAHNADTGRGLMGHFAAIVAEKGGYSDGDSFDRAVEEIAGLGDLDATGVWLGGGGPSMYQGRDTVAPDRTRSAEKVRELGLQVEPEWSQPGSVIDAELDCHDGILVVHEYPEKAVTLDSKALRKSLHGL